MEEENIITPEETIEEEQVIEEEGPSSGRFDRLLGSDARKFKLSGMFKDWYLDYASYVILHRAVPHIVDGLKPVQRRVLHAMYRMDDGAYTKVANIVGQAMQYHPHGDQSILGALVQLGQKGLTVDCQGNWGSILTGDSNAAPRYIEARLSKFAKEVVFDPKVTHWMNSYDGRNQEPTELPVRFPLLLAQGTEGIGVGLASKILPHNFNELLDASVAILEGKPYEIYPDFPTGGFADCSKYLQGKRGGSVKVRARIEKIDKNTVAITEIPYGKYTRDLIDSILKAKDKGKIKIKKIEDMTTDKVDILIHLPNDVSPDKTIDALYAFTDCEINIAPNACVIKDNKPVFITVNEILEYGTYHTRDLLLQELQIKLDELEADWHYSSLERIFFENRVYKLLEQDQKDWETQIQDIFTQMKLYQDLFRREIVLDDILKLVEKPVRKISKFDTKAIDEKILALEEQMAVVRDNIEHIDRYTIDWFKALKKKYGKDFPRRTELTGFETITATKVINNNAKLQANLAEGFVGIGLKRDDGGEFICDCSDLSEIVVIGKDGKYRITKVEDKAFFGKDLLYVGLFNRGDSRTIYNVIYREGKTSIYYAKRFAITSVDARQGIRHHHRRRRLADRLVLRQPQRRGRDRARAAAPEAEAQEDGLRVRFLHAGGQEQDGARQPGEQERHQPHHAQEQGRQHHRRQGHLVRHRHPEAQRRRPRHLPRPVQGRRQGARRVQERHLLHHFLRPGQPLPGRRAADREIRSGQDLHRPLLGRRREELLRQALLLRAQRQHPGQLHLRRSQVLARRAQRRPPPALRGGLEAYGQGARGHRGRGLDRQEGHRRQGQEMRRARRGQDRPLH